MNESQMKLEGWITTSEAAEILGLTSRRIRQLATEERRFEYHFLTPRLLLVKRADVERYKDAQ